MPTADTVVVVLQAQFDQWKRETNAVTKQWETAMASIIDKAGLTEKQARAALKKLGIDLQEIPAEAERSGDRSGNRFSRAFNRRLLTSLVTGAALLKVVEIAKGFGDIDDAAKRAGVSVEKMQELLYAGRTGGIDQNQALKDLTKFNEELQKATRENTDLQKLFNANGISAQEMAKDFEKALLVLSKLIQEADPRDRGRIADMAGLSREWIRELEKGPAAVRKIMAAAQENGAVFDKEAIKKARDFEEAWNKATTRLSDSAKGLVVAFTPFLNLISSILDKIGSAANKTFGVVGQIWDVFTQSDADFFKQMKLPDLERVAGSIRRQIIEIQSTGGVVSPAMEKRLEMFVNRIKELKGETANIPQITIRGNELTSGSKTRVPDALDDSTVELERRTAAQRRELEIVGATTFAVDKFRAAEELRQVAIRNGIPLDDARNKQIELFATRYAEAAEQVRLANERFAAGQALLREFGTTAIDAIQGLIGGTKTLNQALGDVLKTLANMALKAALLGEGPLATFFGTKSAVSGGVGGLFGSIGNSLGGLFGGFRAGGGDVRAGMSYVVGENGPEIFKPASAGIIIPNGSGFSAPGVTMFNDFRDSSAMSIAAIMARIDRMERELPGLAIAAVSGERRLNPSAFGNR